MSRKRHKNKGFKNRPYYDKLAIPINIFEKIRALTLEAEGEISGFGRSVIVSEGLSKTGATLLIKEFDVFNQECMSVHTTLNKEDLTQMYVGVARSGGKPEQWNFWWHSHVEMDTSFSATDDTTMKNLTKPKNGQAGSLLVALCTNKFGDYTATIYKDGSRIVEELPLMILPDLTEDKLQNARQIIKEKVKHVDYKLPAVYKEFGFKAKTLHDNDDFPDITIDDKSIPTLSKNQLRKQERYGVRPKGWAVRP